MSVVTLRQGRLRGAKQGDIHCFHNVPYAQPFTTRFQLPQPVQESNSEYSAETRGPNCSQLPSRLNYVVGPFPESTEYDEVNCGVLSVYTPAITGGEPRPVIVWIHGGAFLTGGSQVSNYDGSKLARDGDVVVVCISYRLGALGFLRDESRSLSNGPDYPAGSADVITAFEWVRDNIKAFGGDPNNVTAFGQSAGGYHTQSLFDIRPDLFHKAILQSSPAGLTNTPEQGEKVRKALVELLPAGTTLETAPVEAILEAQGKAAVAAGASLAAWSPTTSSIPGLKGVKTSMKQVLIGWTATDGLAFAKLVSPQTPVTQLDSERWTKNVFKDPAQTLIEKWRADGHDVTPYVMNWAPEGYELGPTHCIDLPLVFGQDSWKEAPCLGQGSWDEWDKRGKRWRVALGEFAKYGAKPLGVDGVEVFAL